MHFSDTGVCAHVIPSKPRHRAGSRRDATTAVKTANVMGEVLRAQKLLVRHGGNTST
jgi:hypothetical protein